MKPLYGVFDDAFYLQFIEWIELNRMFGVTEFHIYNMTLQLRGKIAAVWKYYIKTGVLFVHGRPPPFAFDQSEQENLFEVSELLSRSAFFDCIHRNYKRAKYILNIDVDEFIVPQTHRDYFAMMQHISNSGNAYPLQVGAESSPYTSLEGITNTVQVGSLTAKMFTFLSEMAVDNTSLLTTIKHRVPVIYPDTRKKGAPFFMKSFINPKICLLPFHHYCLMTVNGQPTRRDLPDSLVWTHHYRGVNKWKNKFRHVVLPANEVLLTFKDALLKKIQEKTGQFGT